MTFIVHEDTNTAQGLMETLDPNDIRPPVYFLFTWIGKNKIHIQLFNGHEPKTTVVECKITDMASKMLGLRSEFNKEIKDYFLTYPGDELLPEDVKKIRRFIRDVQSLWLNKSYTHRLSKSSDEISEEQGKSYSLSKEEKLYLENHRDEIIREANRILDSDDPIVEIELLQDKIIAGEGSNKKFVFVLALSAKGDKKVIIVAMQDAGAGKSYILKQIVFLYRNHSVSHLTKRSLNYVGNLIRENEIEMLYLEELGYMDKENDTHGNASIKGLSMDDGGLSTTYTYREDDGTFSTKTVTTDPITMMTSTIRKKIDTQFSRRAFVFSPDDSMGQTEAIEGFKVEKGSQEDEVALGFRELTDYSRARVILWQLVQMLESVKVIIPFRKSLYQVLDNANIRVRGDYEKINILIECFGILNQRNLPKVKDLDGNEVIVMTPNKALQILKISRNPLSFMATSTDSRDYQLIQAIARLGLDRIDPEANDPNANLKCTIGPQVRSKLANMLGKSRRTIDNRLHSFEGDGYLNEVNKRPLTFEINTPLEEIKMKLTGYKALDANAGIQMLKDMKTEGNEWFKSVGLDFRFN